MVAALIFVGLAVLSHVSGRTLQDVAAQAPTAAAGDAIIALVDPKGVATAMFPVVDGSELKLSPAGVTVVKPDGQTQAVLTLTAGNSTIRILPTATSRGFITILQPNGPSAKVALVPRAAAAPAPAGLAAEIGSMPRFYDWGDWGGWDGGDFGGVSVDVSVDHGDGGSSSGTVSVDVGDYYSGTVTWGGD